MYVINQINIMDTQQLLYSSHIYTYTYIYIYIYKDSLVYKMYK